MTEPRVYEIEAGSPWLAMLAPAAERAVRRAHRRRQRRFMRTIEWLRASSCVAAVALLAVLTASALAQTAVTASQSNASDDVVGIREAADRVLRALDDLDWEPFRGSWSSEPTVFFPFGDTPDRVTGQVGVEARWRRFFEEARARRPGPPYLNLKPREIRVEHYGDVGLVTFTLELTVGGRQLPLQRRTLLFIPEHDAWKPAHIHASGASQP